MPNLPHDVIVDILLRLPVKSLRRFRCVSKPWHSLISDHHFIKMHLNRNHPHNERIIVMRRSLYTVKHQESDNNGAGAVKLDFPGVENPNDWLQILGSCNGLLLVANGAESLFLLNPSTKESKELPESTLIEKCEGKHCDSFSLYGLGYDSRIDDYKVVKIFCKESEGVRRETIVSVCTVGTGSWRRIEDSPYDHSLGDHLPGVFLNGALHWSVCGRMGMDYSGIIASLDLVDEEFRDVPPPSFVEHISEHELGVLRGCLCVLASVDGSHYDVCVMEEYGVKESWVIKFSITVPNFLVKLLCFPTSDEILIENGLNLVIYNPNKETYREVEIHCIPSWERVGTYVESLVSPNYRNGIDTISVAQMDEDNNDDDPSVWPAKNEEKLIVLMEEEVIKGKKKKKTFTKIAWRRIRETLNAQTNKAYDDEQLKNKFNQLKQRQENFKFLLGQAGVGYNDATGKLTASEDLWDRLCKLHKFARRFKAKGWPHYEKLCVIFGDTAASAAANAHPSCQSPPTTNEEDNPIDINFEVTTDDMDEHSYDVDPTNAPKRRSTSSSTSRRAKRASCSSGLTSTLYSSGAAFNRNVDILERSMTGSPSSSETTHKFLKDSMAALNELEDIDGAAYTKAVGKFHEDELWRALFLEMPKNRRKDWVHNLN